MAEQEAEACIDLRRKALTMQHPLVAEALFGTPFELVAVLLSAVHAGTSMCILLHRLCGSPACCEQTRDGQGTIQESDQHLQADIGGRPSCHSCSFYTDDELHSDPATLMSCSQSLPGCGEHKATLMSCSQSLPGCGEHKLT